MSTASTQDVTVLLRLQDDLTRHLARVNRQIQQTVATTRQLNTAGSQAATSVNRLGASAGSTGGALTSLRRSASGANRDFSGLHSTLLSVSSSLGQVAEKAATRAAVGLAAATAAAVTFGVKASASFTQSRLAFGVLLQDQRKGNELFAQLQKFNLQTPFNLKEISRATQTLLAYGVAQQDLLPTLKGVTDVAALNSDDPSAALSGIARAIGQINAAPKLYAQDLNQLTQNGFPAYKLAAQVDNSSIAAVREKLQRGGSISSAAFVSALRAESGVLAPYANGAQALSRTLTGQISNVRDALNVTLGTALQPLSDNITKQLMSLQGKLPALLRPLGTQLNEVGGSFVGGVVRGIPGALRVFTAALAGVNRLVSAALGGLQGSGSLSQTFADGIGRAVDQLVPLMPGLTRAFISLAKTVPPLVDALSRMLALATPLADMAGAILQFGPARQILGGLLAALLGYRALARVVVIVRGMTAALRGLTAASTATAVAGSARAAAGTAAAAAAAAPVVAGVSRRAGPAGVLPLPRSQAVLSGTRGVLGRTGQVVGRFAGPAVGTVFGGLGVVDATRDAGRRGATLGDFGSGALSGALAGASLGSIIPGVGTLLGAGAGALVGLGAVEVAALRRRARENRIQETAVARIPQQPSQTYNDLRIGSVVVNKPASNVDVVEAVRRAQREKAERH